MNSFQLLLFFLLIILYYFIPILLFYVPKLCLSYIQLGTQVADGPQKRKKGIFGTKGGDKEVN